MKASFYRVAQSEFFSFLVYNPLQFNGILTLTICIEFVQPISLSFFPLFILYFNNMNATRERARATVNWVWK